MGCPPGFTFVQPGLRPHQRDPAARHRDYDPSESLVDPLEQRDQFGAFGVAGLVQRLCRRVQEFVGESAREKLDHLLRRRAPNEQPAYAS